MSRLPSWSLAASVSCGLGLLPCDSLCINSGADNSDRNCPVFKCLTLVSWPQILSQQVNRPDTIDRPTHLAKITTQCIEPYRTLRSNNQWKSESHDSQVRRQAVGHRSILVFPCFQVYRPRHIPQANTSSQDQYSS